MCHLHTSGHIYLRWPLAFPIGNDFLADMVECSGKIVMSQGNHRNAMAGKYNRHFFHGMYLLTKCNKLYNKFTRKWSQGIGAVMGGTEGHNENNFISYKVGFT